MVSIRIAQDLDIDTLISDNKAQLNNGIQAAISDLQRCLASLQGQQGDMPTAKDLWKTLTPVPGCLGKLENLMALKRLMGSHSPVPKEQKLSEPRFESWMAGDRPYEEFTAISTILAMKAEGFLQQRGFPKRTNCTRHVFLKSPTDFPQQYRAFRKLAEYFDITITTETTFVGDWNHVRSDPVKFWMAAK